MGNPKFYKKGSYSATAGNDSEIIVALPRWWNQPMLIDYLGKEIQALLNSYKSQRCPGNGLFTDGSRGIP